MTFDYWDPNVSQWAYDQDLARDSRVYGEALGLGVSLATGVGGAVRAAPAVLARGARAVPGLVRAAPGALQNAPAALTRASASAAEALSRAPAWLRQNAGALALATARYLRDEALSPLRPLLRAGAGALRSGVAALQAARSRLPAALREAREARSAATTANRADDALGAAGDAARGAQDGLAQALDPTIPRGAPRAATRARTPREPSGASPRRQPAPPEKDATAASGPWRGTPVMDDGDLKKGWRHIESRHVTGNHPDGPGDLFPAGTTRAQLEDVAREVVERGVRQSDPSQRFQVFERRVRVNGQIDNVRVVVDTTTGRVHTMFPIRGGR